MIRHSHPDLPSIAATEGNLNAVSAWLSPLITSALADLNVHGPQPAQRNLNVLNRTGNRGGRLV